MKYLGIALAFAFLLAGCKVADPPDPQAVTVREESRRGWQAGGADEIRIESVSGDIAVAAAGTDSIIAGITRYATGEDSADALAWLDSVEVKDELSGGELEIECEFPSDFAGHNLGANLEVASPADKELDITLVNGNITVDDMTEDMSVDAVNSIVTVRRLVGGAAVATVNGKVDCDIASITAPETAVLSTVNGDIVLSLPADVAATFDARTGNGTVTVTGFATVNYTTEETRHKAGTIGAGGVTVDIDAANGNVTIKAR